MAPGPSRALAEAPLGVATRFGRVRRVQGKAARRVEQHIALALRAGAARACRGRVGDDGHLRVRRTLSNHDR